MLYSWYSWLVWKLYEFWYGSLSTPVVSDDNREPGDEEIYQRLLQARQRQIEQWAQWFHVS